MDIISKVERPRVVGPLIGGWLGSSGNELLPFQVSTVYLIIIIYYQIKGR
jgi:hypothetical protein